MNKKLLIIPIALLAMSMVATAQSIVSGNNSTSSYFLCASGFPKDWGNNSNGQLGDGTTTNRNTPALLGGLSDIIEITTGADFSIFLKNDGSVWACGRNAYGSLGDGTTTDRHMPVQVNGLSDITAIAGGASHTLFLKSDGTVWACGWNVYGQLGEGTTTNRYTPIQISGLSDITAITAGELHSLFLKNDGSVWACGRNEEGQLGDGTTTNTLIPVQISGMSNIIAISAGSAHSLFLKNDGNVWACGYNSSGQLGDGTTNFVSTPVQVNGVSGIVAISGGGNFSLFLNHDGSVWGCGSNSYGELGGGTTTSFSNATYLQVGENSAITAIAAGQYHSLFMKDDDSVWACGWNGNGQLGDGTTTDRLTPVQVIIDTQCLGVGIKEVIDHFSNLSVYPNPANNSIVVKSKVDNKQSTVKIYNAVGQEILQSARDSFWDNDRSTFDISSLSSGVYFIRLFDGENQRQGKFVKE